jgi:hypothetical protein
VKRQVKIIRKKGIQASEIAIEEAIMWSEAWFC